MENERHPADDVAAFVALARRARKQATRFPSVLQPVRSNRIVNCERCDVTVSDVRNVRIKVDGIA